MIAIECTLKTRKDLRQLTPLEIKIADCLVECYYENDDPRLAPCDLFKEESLPILLYFNVILHLTSLLCRDPFPRQLLKGLYDKLSPAYSDNETYYYNTLFKSAMSDSSDISLPIFVYKTNQEWERVLIWGGLASKIMYHPSFGREQKAIILKGIQNCIKDSSFRERCFDPFLRIKLDEELPPVPVEPKEAEKPLANEPVVNEPQSSETVSEEPLTNVFVTEEPSKEITLPNYIKLDDLLEQAALNYHNNDAFLQSLKVLLLSTINEGSSGDPNVNILLKSKLKLFSQKVKHLQKVEKKKHSTHKFLHLILHPEPKKLLKRLHQLIDGKSGAAVGAVLLRAQQMGYLCKVPTQAEFESEFTLIRGWNAIHNYMNDNDETILAKANQIIIFKGE